MDAIDSWGRAGSGRARLIAVETLSTEIGLSRGIGRDGNRRIVPVGTESVDETIGFSSS